MTTNWERRARQLQVGSSTTKVMTVPCKDSGKWERVLHALFTQNSLPQSEWFKISEEDAISKMKWLASQTNQRMMIGDWKQAQAGNYYRRRKSSSGNWYTEQKSAHELNRMRDLALETAVKSAEDIQTKQSRKEPGYWPTKENPSKIEWQEKDPTYQNWDWLGNALMIVFFGLPAALGVGMGIFMLGYILWPVLLFIGAWLLILKIRGKLD